MKHLPYQIHHIDLQKQINPPPLDTGNTGHYLVFWWQEIPLGHVYLKPGQVLTEVEYWKKLAEATRPALLQYTAGAVNMPAIMELLHLGQPGRWQTQLNHFLSAHTLEQTPGQVPVSVVICTRNRAASLQKCLKSLQNMPCQPAEIIIIDNAPTDQQTKNLVADLKGVRYYLEPRPGLSYARNTGLAKAQYPIVAFTDDDVLVHPYWIFYLWQSFQDPAVAAMTGLVIASELKTETQLIFEQHWSFNRGYTDIIYDQEFFRKTLPLGPPVWEIGAGANMAFRKAIFEEVGLFDVRLGAGASGCSEDSEMWFRILASGQSIHYTPRSVVYHEHRSSLEALHKQLFSYMKGFTAAVLIQHEHLPGTGYRQHLFGVLPKYYLGLIRKGFPYYRFRYRTLGTEIKGLISGLQFYLQHRDKPAYKKEGTP